VASPRKQSDAVIAGLSANDPVNREYDLIFTIAGRKMDFLVEIKSVSDLNVNVQQTVIEALYDSYMARASFFLSGSA
jgi:ATP sulfurylase